jgi:periplasmic divalent cation tolerance protein
MESDVLQVSTSAESESAAASLARSAVQARLAASAQVLGPVRSCYWHEGSYGEGAEWIATFKTTVDRYPELEAHIREAHQWTNPEIVGVRVAAGSGAYLDWVQRTVS